MGLENVRGGGKVIKHVVARHYEIALYEFFNGRYAIGVEVMGSMYLSDPITDLSLANFIFEQRQQSLEGN